MSGFSTLNEDLDRVSRDIESTSYEVDLAREAFLLKEAEHDDAFARVQLEAKASHPDFTQTDLKAFAVTETYGLRMELIKTDSTYRQTQNKLKALRDRFDAIKEISYNTRKECSIQ